MKRSTTVIALSVFALACRAQGINFSKPANWNEVLKQANSENKYIFIDGYATWCKPCKMMDAGVYPSKAVGKLMNDKFISVRVQTDQSSEDDDYTKSWYKEAAQLTGKYRLNALPALLFLSPDGELLYRAEGYQDERRFIGLAKFAIDPKSQAFHAKVDEYKRGKKNYQELPELAGVVSGVMLDDSLSTAMIKDYLDGYINKLTRREDILTHKNLEVAINHLWLINSNNKLITELRKYPAKFSDSLMNWPGGTVGLLSNIVKKDELDWKLWRGNKAINAKPDWNKLEKDIVKKYPQVDARIAIEEFQIYGSVINDRGFFYRVKDWYSLNNYFSKEVRKHLDKEDLKGVNNVCWWYYFCPVTDNKSLALATNWMETMINKVRPGGNVSVDDLTACLDTKAALLYKQGLRHAAIETEEKAIALKQEDNLKKGSPSLAGCAGFLKTVELMKKGEKLGSGYDFIPVIYSPDWKLLDE